MAQESGGVGMPVAPLFIDVINDLEDGASRFC